MQRANLHGRAQIVVGDTTSHGGKVISGSPSSTWSQAKVPIARRRSGDVPALRATSL
mgnify:CR=1 FL=1|jgi:uncharacterized Zn-binding protein involved in type VI secretion